MKECLICRAYLKDAPLMVLEDMPSSAQNIPDAAQKETDFGISLNLCQCSRCGLVQFDCQPVDYYRDVIRAGGFSATMVRLRKRQYHHLIETYGLEGKRFIEVGCGQGEFLSVLGQFPVQAYGIEHKEDLVKLARKQGLKVWQGFPDSEWDSLECPDESSAPYDVFLSFNFLEHQPDPGVMLRCIYRNLAEDGMGLITVPSLEYILEHDGYYELIRDHLAYYTFESLEYVLEQNGFRVLEREMVNRDTLSVIVKKKSEMAVEPKEAVKPVDVSGLKASYGFINKEINELLDKLHQKGKKLAVWGASHQGFTLAATTRLGDKACYMIDSAPFKQGRFAPASHIPIVSPEYYHSHPVDVILIAAPGYTDEIAGIIKEQYGSDVEVLTLRSNHIESIGRKTVQK